ncbi:hypothetical protein O181_035498 [Austropuccinia psidii MF-1]|uniref:Uncharacterized protein n=1 Tax=Austropuccinia psidii MF-1 TaxID=1389203 RepID=A0A9Q3D5K8_9BASI|nr:hypothetical protein [Austropuccinia psidii MF-1]
MYLIDIYNNENRHITKGTNKENTFSLAIYQLFSQEPWKELINEFKGGQFSFKITSKKKLSLLKLLRKNRSAFSIGEETLGKIKGHDIEFYLDGEKPDQLMLRIPPYKEILRARKELQKNVNEILDMDIFRKIGHNKIVELTTPVLIACHDCRYRLCRDFRALNNYTKAERYPIPKIPHSLDKLEKAKYITNIDHMKGFNQNGVIPNSMNLLRITYTSWVYMSTPGCHLASKMHQPPSKG